MHRFIDSPHFDERVARIMERARGLQPHLPDDDEDPLPRFDEQTERNKKALVAEYTDKFGPGWTDDAFCDIPREALITAYMQGGKEAIGKLAAEAFEKYAGSIIDRAINEGVIDA